MPVETQKEHAVVIGASISGLLCARVLANHFSKVTLIEKDNLPESPVTRNAVPQGRHLHVLLGRGYRIIEKYFPDFWSKLSQKGSVDFDLSNDFEWHQWGGVKKRFPSDIKTMFQSRPFFEYYLRGEVLKIKNISLVKGKVNKLITSPAPGTFSDVLVGGVEVEDKNGKRKIDSSWLIIASGRNAPIERWFKEIGCGDIPHAKIDNKIGYASCRIKIPTAFARSWKALAVIPEAPIEKRGGVIVPIEGGQHIVTLFGYADDHPGQSKEDFFSFSKSLNHSSIYNILSRSDLLSDIEIFNFPYSRRRHFHKMSRYPSNVAVVGDSTVSFNPIYGQGMTVAAISAELLDEFFLSKPMKAIQFQKMLAKGVDLPWNMTRDVDRRYPEVGLPLNPIEKLAEKYSRKVDKLCLVDKTIAKRFYEVVNMVSAPSELLKPSILFKVLMK